MREAYQATTLSQVATAAGVSRTAAWAALSDRQTNVGLKAETRQRILHTAKQLNYQKNLVGLSLVKRKSLLISLLCRETYEHTALDVLRGIQDVLLDREYSLLTYAHGDTVENEAHHIKLSLVRGVDGIILMSALDSDGRTNAKQLSTLQTRGFPLVQLFNRTLPGVPTVMMDDHIAGRMATEHLLNLGHRRILYFTHENYRDEQMPGFYALARSRWEGYKEAMEDAGLEPLVGMHRTVNSNQSIFDEAERSASRVLARPVRPTGVVCYCDSSALGLIRGVTKQSIRVPKDISITGIGDLELSRVSFPTLTTLAQPLREIGQTAAHMVLDQTSGPVVEDQVLMPEMQVRASTGLVNARP